MHFVKVGTSFVNLAQVAYVVSGPDDSIRLYGPCDDCLWEFAGEDARLTLSYIAAYSNDVHRHPGSTVGPGWNPIPNSADRVAHVKAAEGAVNPEGWRAD